MVVGIAAKVNRGGAVGFRQPLQQVVTEVIVMLLVWVTNVL